MRIFVQSSSLIPGTAWHGKLALTYRQQGSKTVPVVQTQAPLKVQRPFYPEGESVCHSVVLHTAGGMVGGDRLSYAIVVEPGAHAWVTTTAAAKIYGDHPHQRPAIVAGTVQVAAGACLEWLPQESIMFSGAHYHQRWRIDLAPGAHWLGWDILRLGRTAHGEKFLAGEVRSRFEVFQNQRSVWVDPQWLLGDERTWSGVHGLHQCPVIGTLAYVGQPVPVEWVAAARDCWPAARRHPGEAGVTRLQAGLLCRYRGHSTQDARRWFEAVWHQLRPHYAQRPALRSRLWQR